MGPRKNLLFCECKTALLAPELLVSMVSSPHLWFLRTPNSVHRTRTSSLCGLQPSPVVLCLQKGDFRTRIACICGAQTSPVVLCIQNSVISTRNTSLYESQPSSVVFACKTATFGQELQVFMGSRPHLVFCVCKTAALDQNYKSLWVQALICVFVHWKQRL